MSQLLWCIYVLFRKKSEEEEEKKKYRIQNKKKELSKKTLPKIKMKNRKK